MGVVVGISGHYHDAAACVVVDGEVVAAAQEERFTRIKFDAAFPAGALRSCLRHAGLYPPDVDAVAYYEDPDEKLDRIVWTAAAGVGDVREVARGLRDRLEPLHPLLPYLSPETRVMHFSHHASHAASAFYASGFERAGILTLDGVGGWATTALHHGGPDGIAHLHSIAFPDSLGFFYAAITAFLGFTPNSDEYKVMGLAAFGSPRLVDELRHVLGVDPAGDIRLDPLYLDLNHGMNGPALATLLGFPPRQAGEPMHQRYADVAASAQALLEEAVLALAHRLHDLTGEARICLAGGVALNCLAMARLREEGPFDAAFVQPAAGDAGGALGAAYLAAAALGDTPAPMTTALLGPGCDAHEAGEYLDRIGATSHRLGVGAMAQRVADLLAAGAIVGWVEGRMEFGPRALGARSILADPRDAATRDLVNERVKGREGFRPFAPVCLAERAGELFDAHVPEPFMTFVVRVREPQRLGAVTHADGTARLQTVQDRPEGLVALLRAFAERSGVPCLLNTSFNLAGQPVVCTAADAFKCFREGRLDALVLADRLVIRDEQAPTLVEPGTQSYLEFARELRPMVRDVYALT